MKLSRVLQIGAGVALAAAGLWIFFYSIDKNKDIKTNIDAVGKELSSCPWPIILACIVFGLMTLVFRAWRWKIMLPDVEKTNKRNLFQIVSIGFMLNNILPARLGEVGRIVLLWKKNGYNPAQSVGSVVLERIFDILGFMSCFFFPVFVIDSLRTAQIPIAIDKIGIHIHLQLPLLPFAIVMCAVFAAGCFIVFLYARFPAGSRKSAKKLLGLLPFSMREKAASFGADVLSNLNWIFSLKKTALVVMHTYCMMLCYAVMFAALAQTHGFTVIHGLFAQAFAAIGAAIPFAPGYVGTLDAVLQQGFFILGFKSIKASAITLLYHAIPYFPITFLGLFYFFRMRVSLKEITDAKKSAQPPSGH